MKCLPDQIGSIADEDKRPGGQDDLKFRDDPGGWLRSLAETEEN